MAQEPLSTNRFKPQRTPSFEEPASKKDSGDEEEIGGSDRCCSFGTFETKLKLQK
jgi:hypothetical protein